MNEEVPVRGYPRVSSRHRPHFVSPHARRHPSQRFPANKTEYERGLVDNEEYRPIRVIEMTPLQYLQLVNGPSITSLDAFRHSSSYHDYKENDARKRIRGRIETWIPSLVLSRDYENGTWHVMTHEGRHRVLAAGDEGIRSVPVRVYFPEGMSWGEIRGVAVRPSSIRPQVG